MTVGSPFLSWSLRRVGNLAGASPIPAHPTLYQAPRENALVVRSNKLIEASFEASVLQLRIWFWLISELRPEDREFQSYRIYVRDLARFVGIDRNKDIYARLREATHGMLRNTLVIERESQAKRARKGAKNTLQVAMLSSAEYEEGAGYVSLSFDPKLRPYLLDIKENFTRSKLRELVGLRNAAAVRIYELLDQYRSIGKRNVSLDDLRLMLRLGDKYKLYGDVKRRIITPAVTEINARSDLSVEVEELRAGRRVTGVRFVFSGKSGFGSIIESHEGEAASDEARADGPAIMKRMVALGMSASEAVKYHELYGETDPKRLTGNCSKLESEIRNGAKIKKPGAWLAKAIREDWRDQQALFVQEHAEAERVAKERADRKAKERKRRAGSVAKLEAELTAAREDYLVRRQEFVGSILKDLDQATLAQWRREFAETLRGFFAERWRKEGDWTSRFHITDAEKFVKAKTGNECESCDSYLVGMGRRTTAVIQDELDALR